MKDTLDVLVELAAADDAAPEPQTFVLYYSGVGRVIVGHPGWPDDVEAPSHVEVDELAERGWVRVERVEGSGRSFAITAAGRDRARARVRQLEAAAVSGVSLDWGAVNPVLERFYEAYEQAGAPEHGVESEAVLRETDNPESARAALRELVRGGYLEGLADVEQVDIPLVVRPTPLAVQQLGGWPGSTAEEVVDGLVTELSREITTTTDTETRSALVRVRDGLLGAARDVAVAWAEKKVGG